ncbi:MAG: SDR family oxidoreductase [Planctomycetes bacterium]|nr:SDR family oxidoreductase [Planctomycetota bacterium]MCL4731462.1 SDR family oxidoreductase [Planctomycetota bacterium]
MTDFLQLEGKVIAVFGAANRKSVAWLVGETLAAAGARVVHVVRDAKIAGEIEGLLRKSAAAGAGEASALRVLTCDVEKQAEIDAVATELGKLGPLHGFVHSLAFANYSDGFKPFHETRREDFLQALNISAFSLVALANALKPHLAPDSAVVTIGISTTRMAAENYGYMAPIKAALHSSVVFLAKSFGQARVRFNAVCPGLLKTSASAGIPGYLDSYLFAEQATLRKQAVATQEVANAVAFLLSPRSSGINAQEIVVDAGMGVNYFDKAIVSKATK